MDLTWKTFKEECAALFIGTIQMILAGLIFLVSIGTWIASMINLSRWLGGYADLLMGAEDFDTWAGHVSLRTPTHHAIEKIVLLVAISMFLHYATREKLSKLLAVPQGAWRWIFESNASRATARKWIVWGILLPIHLIVYGKLLYTIIHVFVPLYR